MYKETINKIKPSLDKVLTYLTGELNKLRVGRATPALIEDLQIESYGQKMPLKQLANISTPQARLLTIQPWDKTILETIERSISQSSLGLNPVIDGDLIRINIPQLSEERRKELLKILGEKSEEAKISIRHKREEVWKELQDLEKDNEISEDDKFKGKEELQKIIDEYNKKVEEISKRKEGEIMTV